MKKISRNIALLSLLTFSLSSMAADSSKTVHKPVSAQNGERYVGLASVIEGLHFMKAGIDHQLDLQDSESEKAADPATHLGHQMLAAKQANSEYGMAQGYFERNVSSGLDRNGESAMILKIIPLIVKNNKADIRIMKRMLSSSTPGAKPMDAGEMADQTTTLRNSNDQAWSVIYAATGLLLHEIVQCSTAPGGTCNRLGLTTSHRIELSKKLLNYWGDGVKQVASSRSVVDASASQIYGIVISTGYQSIDGSYLPGVEAPPAVSSATYIYAH